MSVVYCLDISIILEEDTQFVEILRNNQFNLTLQKKRKKERKMTIVNIKSPVKHAETSRKH